MKQKTLKLSKLYWVSLKAAIADIQEKNVALIAAGVAFYGMLSLFPALAALVTILSLISDPVVVIAQLDDMRGLLPDDVYKIINEQVVTLVTASTGQLGWTGAISVLAALWSARAGVGAMMIGLNGVYNERNRNAARHYFSALMLTFKPDFRRYRRPGFRGDRPDRAVVLAVGGLWLFHGRDHSLEHCNHGFAGGGRCIVPFRPQSPCGTDWLAKLWRSVCCAVLGGPIHWV